jgi:FAD/FMN-containing dehydrogenase/Fe-S oxidoreductase
MTCLERHMEWQRSSPSDLHTDAAHLAVYSRAACIYRRRPRGVSYPRAPEDLHGVLALCAERGWPLTLRGGGSGLAGQSVGEGVVADVSRHLNRLISVDPERREAQVEPGLVLSDLNRRLAALGLRFSPDPSSQDFCTLGGMLADNSKGPRSVKYGTTVHHVKALDLLLADGSEVHLERGFRPPREYPHPALRNAAELILSRRAEILRRWPRSRTNASGYNVRDCLNGSETVDLLPLFVGSEGTLAVFLRATLNLLPLPKHQRMALLGFPDVASAGRAVQDLLPLGPSACELLDQTFLEMIRRGLGSFPFAVDEAVRCILLLEADGESAGEAEAGLDALLGAARSTGPVTVRRASDASESAAIWSFRKAASPLLNKGRGALKSIRFIEDGAVPTEAIPAYLAGVREILGARGIDVVVFGHAGDGNFHVNPFMNLKDPEHHRQMPLIAGEVSRLLSELGGTLSGEHGDGRLRTPYLREIYGDLVDLFREIKLALDPQEVLNPGIIAPAEPEPLDKGLRFSPAYARARLPSRLSEESWAFEAERCHGCGSCRDFCPTAQATDHDLLSSRGRGHLLQALLAGELSPREARKKEVREIFESCLGCSLCAIHCPTGVDIAPLAAAFRETHTPPLTRARDRFLGSLPKLSYFAGPGVGRALAEMANFAPVRAGNRLLLGIRSDMRVPKPAPALAFDPAGLVHVPGRGEGKALYFYGCYGNSHNPSGEAELAVAVLAALGVEVVVPPQACCGVSKFTRGLAAAAEPDVTFNRRSFLPYVRQGFTVVASAPSCLLALKEEQRRFFPGAEADELSLACADLFSFLKPRVEARRGDLAEIPLRAVYQTPCHSQVLGTYGAEVAVLSLVPGLQILDVTSECCGLAGSFGAQARRAELSRAVADPLYARIRRLAPEAVITPCGSCKVQDEAQLGLPVYHPLTLLARALKLEAPAFAGAPCATVLG